jgi:hypothetical protein
MIGSGHRVARPRAHGAPQRRSRLLDEGKTVPTPPSAYLTSPYLSLILVERKSQDVVAAMSSPSSRTGIITSLLDSSINKHHLHLLYLSTLVVEPAEQGGRHICLLCRHWRW